MFLRKSHLLIKSFSASAISRNWRSQIQQNQVASEISSILLQRRNWVSLLRNLDLSSKLAPSLFLRILRKIETQPQISLNFFNWVKTNLGFQPDLKSYCQVIQAAIGSGLYRPVKPLFDSLIRDHPSSAVVECLIRVCKGSDLQSNALSLVLECYSRKGLPLEGLKVFSIIRLHGFTPIGRSCNALLDTLQRENNIQLAWCLYGALIRCGLCPNRYTWPLVAEILSKNGRFDRIVRLLDFGICDSTIYNIVIDGYCNKGDFKSAFDTLSEMCARKLTPGFVTYSSILNGACKHEDVEVIDRIMNTMVEKGLLPKCSSANYDSLVRKLSDLGKTYAAERFFKQAYNENVHLRVATYGCLLKALSNERRICEAIYVHRIISQRGLVLDDSNYHAFVEVLCGEDPSEEGCQLLESIVRRGYSPSAEELSKYMLSLCNRGRWKGAEDLLNVLLEKGIVPDSACCCLLMEHYCSGKEIDSAIGLHNKIEKLNVRLDIAAYDVLLNGLFAAGRIDETIKVFDYMRRQNTLSSASFIIMIRGLCSAKELRNAMKLHDEMLKMGLKPDKPTYKRLISGFK
ncbi:hypothetical protein L6164_032180 [Bauhinia variegata]|uniref:Uncharacterized protein n=1 Tax=Bauhinia variegata TaxID=167791 RepID=A0ACB9KMQ9_BAUVA|nr:hypothetical protein L6164_032180 [Bauhinia variegata]